MGADYAQPSVRLPGAGGAPEIAASCREVIVVVRQSRRSFVERVDFVTSVGFGDGAGYRERLGLAGAGPRKVITDLGILEPDPATCELTLTGLYPGVTVADVGGQDRLGTRGVGFAGVLEPPTAAELTALRQLQNPSQLNPSQPADNELKGAAAPMTTHPPSPPSRADPALVRAAPGTAPAAGLTGLPVHGAAGAAAAAADDPAGADRDHRPAAR